MSFNVNYLAGTSEGLIPLNPDSWLKANRKIADKYIDEKPVYNNQHYGNRMFLNNLFEAYWTVRSFKIDFRIMSIDLTDPFVSFMAGGGASYSIIGATAGLAAAESNMGQNGVLVQKGYTKIVNRYYKTIKKIKNGIESDEADTKANPNPIESYIYKTNEGTLVSPGPVHSFVSSSLTVKIDFSDIIMKRSVLGNVYYPKITINGRNSNFTVDATNTYFGGGQSVLRYLYFMGSLIPVNITTNTTSLIPPFILFNCTIEPGDRCCDRFYWDGKDKDREKDCESCNDKENKENIELDGVYLNPKNKI